MLIHDPNLMTLRELKAWAESCDVGWINRNQPGCKSYVSYKRFSGETLTIIAVGKTERDVLAAAFYKHGKPFERKPK